MIDAAISVTSNPPNAKLQNPTQKEEHPVGNQTEHSLAGLRIAMK